jgi:HAD superfamily hydrolase (TIGR01509 family)
LACDGVNLRSWIMHSHGLILDIDGTLIDSNDAHARAWVDALAEDGFDVAFDRIRPLIGMGGDKILPRVAALAKDDPRGERISERRRAIFLERYFPEVKPFPRVRDLLLRAQQEGFKLAVATSASEDEVEPLLERAGVADILRRRTSSDDADRSKPDPDIVQAALRKAKLHPDAAIMLGDTPYDIEAARRAGVDAVALLTGGWDCDALKDAIAIYDDPDDILRHFTASPFASAA